MHFIDLSIFVVYMAVMVGVGVYFYRKNQSADDYFVGGRRMGSVHVGLSVVATDVGGGFSIGLGGLGFIMGLSGSWMLFTGLLGAWLSAVFLIPKVKGQALFANLQTFPQVFGKVYGPKVALVAGIISAVGYLGFTSSQILAGAKLASGTFVGLDHQVALWVMGAVAVVYTVLGGLKAVILTDTVQWIILILGLSLVGIPVSYFAVGGWASIEATLAPEMLRLDHIRWQQVVNWGVTILPIWFVGMTLYQRIYACADEKSAKRAWYIAGFLEWPVMAFMGVSLGLLARVAAEQGLFGYLGAGEVAAMDPETGLPMLLRTVLPVGLMGVMMSAYFSAILSTADSCLMAASGNLMTDVARVKGGDAAAGAASKRFLRRSQVVTAVVGVVAVLLASQMTEVLSLMLYSYAFMVSGLLVPLLGALYSKRGTPTAALAAMVVGGGTTLGLAVSGLPLPLGLDGNLMGLSAALVVFVAVSLLAPVRRGGGGEEVRR